MASRSPAGASSAEKIGRARDAYGADRATARELYAADRVTATRSADSINDARKRMVRDAMEGGLMGEGAGSARNAGGAAAVLNPGMRLDENAVNNLIDIRNSNIRGDVFIDNSVTHIRDSIFFENAGDIHDSHHPFYYSGLSHYYGSGFSISFGGYSGGYNYYSHYGHYGSHYYYSYRPYYHYNRYSYSYTSYYDYPAYYSYDPYYPHSYYGGSWYYTPHRYYPRSYYYRHRPSSFYYFVNLGDYGARNVPESYIEQQALYYGPEEEIYIFEAEDSLGRAYAGFASKDYYRSVVDFSNALAERPEDGLLYLSRAQAYIAIADYRSAYYDLITGMEMIPDWVDVRLNLSEIYNDGEELTGHLEALQGWVERHPKDFRAHFVLGYVYYYLQQYELAKFELVYSVAGGEDRAPAQALLEAIYEIQAEAEFEGAVPPAAEPEPVIPPVIPPKMR